MTLIKKKKKKIICIEFDFTKPLCKMGSGWQMRPNELCSYNHVGAPWMTQILCIEFDLTKPLCNMGSVDKWGPIVYGHQNLSFWWWLPFNYNCFISQWWCST